MALTHSPGLTGWFDRAPENQRRDARRALDTMRERLRAARPDVILLFSNDHLLNWPINNTPEYTVGLGAEHVDRAARTLSTGERTRALMAVFQARQVNLLVLDEPTNHLDVPAIEQLEAALAAYDGTLVVVSHDERFVEAVGVTRRLDVQDGRVADLDVRR